MLVACGRTQSTSPPSDRTHTVLRFEGMPEGGSVACIEGCQGRATEWLDPHTLRITPVTGPAEILLHYQAEGVDRQIHVKIVPIDLTLRFPSG